MDWSELKNWEEYTKLLIGLLAISDPLGTIPVLLGITEDATYDEQWLSLRWYN